ncbi:DUF2239 family protein [Roseomonas sp. SSH11]|uniref:DUF2239 family protein n=1 Tax=Pararoseomonas baculiformis TaxID=2820812 RepID=A0ABS4AFA2_9PROT|nr:DUF2239 family protein [Pararoseomonas baculiformis]MBP0445556.1 DUF2239 family protein [Pararoseomonas baculiformis]
MDTAVQRVTAFDGHRLLASGTPAEVAMAIRARPGEAGPVLVFDDRTGQQVDFDLRGTDPEVLARLAPPRGPGRPRLGVVAREVTLLPRHWEWLAAQPGGASVALRKLVEAAMRGNAGAEAARLAREAADRFMAAIAGDAPGYEEASRALYAGDAARFRALTEGWPADLRDHARRLAAPGLAGGAEAA